MKTLILILAFAFAAFAQAELPDYGKIEDIAGKTKVYIVADGEAKKAILKKFKGSQLVAVDRADDAEFMLEYKTIARDHVSSLQILMETGQIDVYIYREKRKVIVWTKSKVGGGFKGDTPGAITGTFVKEFAKSQKPKK